ncbi:MAG TPA: outer membrane beta-barrel protein [Steroidobacteraceae bacterium]|jgi:hypothetical protein
MRTPNRRCGHTVRQSIVRVIVRASALGAALATLTLPIPAHAEFLWRLSGSSQYESNNNVFDLDNRALSDTYLAYGAEADVIYLFGRQNLYARVDAKQINYQKYSGLNHNEYDVVTRFIWKLTSDMDGLLGVVRTHAMVPFLDTARSGSDFSLSTVTTQAEQATFNLKVSPLWGLTAEGDRTEFRQPSPGQPDVQLTDNAGKLTLNYFGLGKLTTGFMGSYSTGGYDGSSTNASTVNPATENPSYEQLQASFVSSFSSGRTVYTGTLGYTSRSSSDTQDKTSGITGSLDFIYRLTPKTSYRLKIDRAVNNYLANAGSELDSSIGGGISWKPSAKLSVGGDYTWVYREFPAQGLLPGQSRTDHQQSVSLSLGYQPTRWMIVGLYGNYQTRGSNQQGLNVDATVYGISVTVQTADQSNAESVPMESHWH